MVFKIAMTVSTNFQ